MVNPYLPPTTAEGLKPRVTRISRKAGAVALFVAVSSGLVLGAATNVINGYVSPEYVRDVMGWRTPHIHAAAITQGAIEGSFYAVLATILLLFLAMLFTRRILTTRTIVQLQLSALFADTLLWFLGGATAVVTARYFPQICNPEYFGYTSDWPKAGYYAWVRGSIWGSVYGSVIAVFLSLVVNRSQNRDTIAS